MGKPVPSLFARMVSQGCPAAVCLCSESRKSVPGKKENTQSKKKAGSFPPSLHINALCGIGNRVTEFDACYNLHNGGTDKNKKELLSAQRRTEHSPEKTGAEQTKQGRN